LKHTSSICVTDLYKNLRGQLLSWHGIQYTGWF